MHGDDAGTSLFISPDGKKFYAIIGCLCTTRKDFARCAIANSIRLVGDVGGELENVARGLMAKVLDPETHEQARLKIDSYLTDKASSDSSVEFNGIHVNVSGLLEYLDSLAIQENAETKSESKISESIIHCDTSVREFYTSKTASEIFRKTNFSNLGANAIIVVTEISKLLRCAATEMQNNRENKLKKELKKDEKEVLKNYRLVYGSGSIASMEHGEELTGKLRPESKIIRENAIMRTLKTKIKLW